MGLTSKPCHGCGKDRGGRRFRESDDVCTNCAFKLRNYDAVMASAAQRNAFERVQLWGLARFYEDEGCTRTITTSPDEWKDYPTPEHRWPHFWPPFYDAPAPDKVREALCIAMGRVVTLFVRPDLENDGPMVKGPIGDQSGWQRTGLLPSGLTERLMQLDEAIRAMLKAAYAAGRQEGSSLLLSLAADETTLTKLNDQTVGKD